jgi:hypothetical protein
MMEMEGINLNLALPPVHEVDQVREELQMTTVQQPSQRSPRVRVKLPDDPLLKEKRKKVQTRNDKVASQPKEKRKDNRIRNPCSNLVLEFQ